MSFHDQFIGYYPTNVKTLTLQAIPQYETADNLKDDLILEKEMDRSGRADKVKTLIDEFNRDFITHVLDNMPDNIVNYANLRSDFSLSKGDPTNADARNRLHEAQANARKRISGVFTSNPEYKNMSGKTFITETLPEYALRKHPDETGYLDALETFKKSTTYFKDYIDLRNLMYTPDAKAIVIAHRIIDENFPTFCTDLDTFDFYVQNYPAIIEEAEASLKELLGDRHLSDFFDTDHYSELLTQKSITFFNTLIGGYTTATEKIRGINEVIINYTQKHPEELSMRGRRLMLPLYKQIFCDASSLSFILTSVKTDSELVGMISSFYEQAMGYHDGQSVVSVLGELLNSIDNYNTKHVYVSNQSQLGSLSIKLFGTWSVLSGMVRDLAEENAADIKKKTAREKEINSILKGSTLSVDYIDTAIRAKNRKTSVKEAFGGLYGTDKQIREQWKLVQPVIEKYKNSKHDLGQDQKSINAIQTLLDLFVSALRDTGIIDSANDQERDTNFYSVFDEAYEVLRDITPLYNQARAYLTKKTYSSDRIFVNFGYPQFAEGWESTKERERGCILFRHEGFYYIGIMNPDDKPVIEEGLLDTEDSTWEKMNYNQMADPAKDLPNLMVIDGKTVRKTGRRDKETQINTELEELKQKYLPENINRIRLFGSYLRSRENFNRDDLTAFIDYYMQRIIEYKKGVFDFVFEDPSEYESWDDFLADINSQAYRLTMVPFDGNKIREWVRQDKMYLFQLYNNDFNPYAKGKPKLYTMYFKALFAENNQVFKLNGGAELFYQFASLKSAYIHRAGSKLINKVTTDGKTIPGDIYWELLQYYNEQTDSLSPQAAAYVDRIKVKDADNDIIKDRRHTKDKFVFHMLVTINYQSPQISQKLMNQAVNATILSDPSVNFMGIYRSVKNMLYVSIVDRHGKVLYQKSLNAIPRSGQRPNSAVNYKEKIDVREAERKDEMRSWSQVSSVKELKEGYLSQVVHEISQLMLKYNAVIVLEDLNIGSGKKNTTLDRQLYQKFEKQLIDKLNYLVFKDRDEFAAGGIYRGYQLCYKFQSFEKLGKQSGCLYFVPSSYVSQVDPLTGFINLFDMSFASRNPSAKAYLEFMSSFKDIHYDRENGVFVFSFNYDDFRTYCEFGKREWTVTSAGERIAYDKSKKEYYNRYPTEEIKQSLESMGIAYADGRNIVEDLKSLDPDSITKQDISSLYSAFSIILKMANVNDDTGEDYVISPVLGSGFDSRTAPEGLPADTDANGAYHMALKGLCLCGKGFNGGVSNKDWLKYIQARNN